MKIKVSVDVAAIRDTVSELLKQAGIKTTFVQINITDKDTPAKINITGEIVR